MRPVISGIPLAYTFKSCKNLFKKSLEELNEGKEKRKMKGWEKGGSGGKEQKQRRGDEGQGKKKMKYWE